MSNDNIFAGLNDMQHKAVLHTEGPLLLLAGAGSGKTRVLTHRIAYLIEKGVNPFNIIAITFTNKAAKEMKERVSAITPRGGEVWVSTFHSACVRILRREIDKIGMSNKFSIYDSGDTQRLITDILRINNISEDNYPPKMIMSVISRCKDKMITPEEHMKTVEKDFRERKIAEVYKMYQQRLEENNALDFDDLIFKTVTLFRQRPDVLDKYQERFRYILVDEYQDTNYAQYQLIKLLAQKYHNLCVVGDDDQSIYGWRGADINNILDFEKDFKDTTVIKLEQNYRSTSNILDSANSVIKRNKTRKDKALWTESDSGNKLKFYHAQSEREEAEFVCRTIEEGVKNGKKYSDYAVLYRINALSRSVEERLVRENIPYRIFSGIRFYERMEIADILGYLKYINNPEDEMPLKRIINVPKRNIGNTSVSKITLYAMENGISFYRALRNHSDVEGLTSRAHNAIDKFLDLSDELMAAAQTISVPELIEKILVDTGYRKLLIEQRTDEASNRLENLDELKNKAVEFSSSAEDPTLSRFLEEVALIADVDNFTEDDDTVVLMTIHSAKGLEFDTVFIVGFEENIFPARKALDDPTFRQLEEERRLCYVAITRAKNDLYLTAAKARYQYGYRDYHEPSRFLKDIPDQLIDKEEEDFSSYGDNNSGFGFGTVHHDNSSRNNFRRFSYNADKKVNSDYEIGDMVKHIKFGIGIVLDMEPVGDDYEVTVIFKKTGTKKIRKSCNLLSKI